MPARATAAKLSDDSRRTRRVRAGLVGSLGGALPSGVSAMAVVVVVGVSWASTLASRVAALASRRMPASLRSAGSASTPA
ncbi:hypothetical protein WR25_10198 [Diploscapter pachys]|uniref:Uncharacterized protein n=1 Tax=Diploscapter pachys TaxID=2018661 RepID=A0A2A2KBV0_9BILA|nr:hypothetical protein WR25_10198 [Diploscapter pachys]